MRHDSTSLPGLEVFQRQGANRGKSGAFRYLYLEKAETIYLLVFFSKNEKDNLSKAERNAHCRVSKASEKYLRIGRLAETTKVNRAF